MVIIYDLTSKELVRTEDNTMAPVLPTNMTFDEKKEFYKGQGQGFIGIPYEMGKYILNFKLCFDTNNNFIGLEPKVA
ncbi:hypothetical protein [Clostridium omnivorum]|uniref:Uncharacterized protein n=1 Tax=Clostridium omnivorum TaxID=1604902 RepID=A0ABQ5NCL9_9CLOT|nr:hypothetical protein [Clostridium sp. E14]GLC32927.1 hypothetical protein bsdE14_43370 [Clostridium sp. E14]